MRIGLPDARREAGLMGKTPIQWSEFSINPIRARGPHPPRSGHHCVKVSPGCKNCYSSRMQPRFGLPQFQEQRGEKAPELFLDPKVLAQVLRRKKPTKWFWCDMTDIFGEWVPFEWIAACFGIMAATPQHTHQVLTKRPARALEFFVWLSNDGFVDGRGTNAGLLQRRCGDAAEAAGVPIYRTDRGGRSPWNDSNPGAWPLPNVHLGVSCEDQQRADERIPELLRCPAAVCWVSAEPLLGPINFGRIPWGGIHTDVLQGWTDPKAGIRWIVVGGESGRRARPFDIGWGRNIIEQCRVAGVACFIKQLGACPVWTTHPGPDGETERIKYADSHGGDPREWPPDLRVREFPAP